MVSHWSCESENIGILTSASMSMLHMLLITSPASSRTNRSMPMHKHTEASNSAATIDCSCDQLANKSEIKACPRMCICVVSVNVMGVQAMLQSNTCMPWSVARRLSHRMSNAVDCIQSKKRCTNSALSICPCDAPQSPRACWNQSVSGNNAERSATCWRKLIKAALCWPQWSTIGWWRHKRVQIKLTTALLA